MTHRLRAATMLLLTAVFLLGVAHVAILPPFEGYDETAHWSYIQQLADTGHVPVYGVDRISADVDAYAGPMQSAQGQPYRDYLAGGGGPVAGAPTHFSPGQHFNWQAQHPPLYYVMMALPYRLLAGEPWRTHLFGLRLASWCIAFAGFAWGGVLAQRLLRRRDIEDARLLLPVVWPFLFPEFYPEFARLTNDALCLVLATAAWWLVLGLLEPGASWRRALALGGVLGAGLLTKAFFLPVTAGLTTLLLTAALAERGLRRLPVALAVPAVAFLIGGAWYVAKLRSTGTLTGSADMIELDAKGGLLAGLRQHFSLVQYVRGTGGILLGFCWGGTWSFVHPSRWLSAPVSLLPMITTAMYLYRSRRLTRAELTPLFIVAPVVAGLLFHLLAMVAETGIGNGTPGWYLHIFAGPLSLVLVLGLAGRAVMLPMLVYAVAFFIGVACLQATFFSGCLSRVGDGKVSFLQAGGCMMDLSGLQSVALPQIALAACLLAAAFASLAIVAMSRRQAGSA